MVLILVIHLLDRHLFSKIQIYFSVIPVFNMTNENFGEFNLLYKMSSSNESRIAFPC